MKRLKDFEKNLHEIARRISAPLSEKHLYAGSLISMQYKYLYIPTPKVACSTIKMALLKMELDQPDIEYFPLIHNLTRSPFLNLSQIGDAEVFINRPDIFRFCFVRNPYTRLLSAYLDKIGRHMPPKESVLAKMGLSWKENRKKEISFIDFIKVIRQSSLEEMDQHWRPQVYQCFFDKIEYDFIGNFENLDEDLISLNRNFRNKLYTKIKTVNEHATKSGEQIRKYYANEKVRNIVYEIYKKDFETFGYSKDIEQLESSHRK